MLSSCPQDRHQLGLGGVYVWDGSVCRGRSWAAGQKTHFSSGATRGNSFFGHNQYSGGAGLLECFHCDSPPSLITVYTFTSPSPFTFLPPLSLCAPCPPTPCPFISDNCLNPFLSHSNPRLIFGLGSLSSHYLSLLFPRCLFFLYFVSMSPNMQRIINFPSNLSASTAALLSQPPSQSV